MCYIIQVLYRKSSYWCLYQAYSYPALIRVFYPSPWPSDLYPLCWVWPWAVTLMACVCWFSLYDRRQLRHTRLRPRSSPTPNGMSFCTPLEVGSEKLQAVAYKLIFCKMVYMQYLNNLYLYYYWFQFIFYVFFQVDVYFFMKIFWKTIAVMILIIVDI